LRTSSIIVSCIGATSGRPRKARASSGVQSTFMVIFIVPLFPLAPAPSRALPSVSGATESFAQTCPFTLKG